METNFGTNSLNRLIGQLKAELNRSPQDAQLKEQYAALMAARSLARLLGTQKGRRGAQIVIVLPAGEIKRRERVKVQIGKPLSDQRQTYHALLNTRPSRQSETIELVGFGRHRVGLRFKAIMSRSSEEVRLRPTLGTRLKLRMLKLSSLRAESELDQQYVQQKLKQRQLLHW